MKYNIEDYAENFCYDALNRLTSYALFDGGGSTACSGGTVNKTIGYDAGFPNGIGDGNISGKSDIGLYAYGQFGAGPHAVTSIDTTTPGGGGCTLSSCKYDGISNPNFFAACPPAAPRADRWNADGNIRCVTPKACDGYAVIVLTISSSDRDEQISRDLRL